MYNIQRLYFHLEFYFISIERSGRVWIMRSNIDPNFAVELETPPNTTSQIQLQMQIQTQILTPTMQYNWGP